MRTGSKHDIKDERIDGGKAVRLGQSVLDLGTGTGVLPRNMYSFGAKWTGTDISPEQIEQAKKLSQGMGIGYYAMPAEKIDFPDASFDAATACQCSWYFDHEKLIPQLCRMLKSNGRLLVLCMEWLPFEDKIAGMSENLVLRYSSDWSDAGKTMHPIEIPACYKEKFDLCPNSPDKTAPGVCGCDVPDTLDPDTGIPLCVVNSIDFCPNDPDKKKPGVCGCGVPDIDTDGDTVPDCLDKCPEDPNKTLATPSPMPSKAMSTTMAILSPTSATPTPTTTASPTLLKAAETHNSPIKTANGPNQSTSIPTTRQATIARCVAIPPSTPTKTPLPTTSTTTTMAMAPSTLPKPSHSPLPKLQRKQNRSQPMTLSLIWKR